MINTERLTISIASDKDVLEMIEKQTDEELKKAYGEMYAGCISDPQNRQWYAPWIIKLKNGTVIGDLCFKGVTEKGAVEIGYGLLPDFWGNGYATEAVTAVINRAFMQNGIKCIEAETEPDNKASQRVLLKAGFVSTGEIGEEGPRFVKYK